MLGGVCHCCRQAPGGAYHPYAAPYAAPNAGSCEPLCITALHCPPSLLFLPLCSPRLTPNNTADLTACAGGFFDGKTSAEERQRYLLDTIRTSTQQQQQRGGGGSGGAEDGGRGAGEGGGAGSNDMTGSGGTSSGAMSDTQLNRLLARGDAELELFESEDRRVQVGGCKAPC